MEIPADGGGHGDMDVSYRIVASTAEADGRVAAVVFDGAGGVYGHDVAAAAAGAPTLRAAAPLLGQGKTHGPAEEHGDDRHVVFAASG